MFQSSLGGQKIASRRQARHVCSLRSWRLICGASTRPRDRGSFEELDKAASRLKKRPPARRPTVCCPPSSELQMAPKGKPTTPGKGGKGGKDAGPAEDAGAAKAASAASAPKNKDEVLAQINLDGLPHCPTDQIIELVRDKYDVLVAVFIHYCKQSECKTLEMATRLRLGALPPLTPTLPRSPLTRPLQTTRSRRARSSSRTPTSSSRCTTWRRWPSSSCRWAARA